MLARTFPLVRLDDQFVNLVDFPETPIPGHQRMSTRERDARSQDVRHAFDPAETDQLCADLGRALGRISGFGQTVNAYANGLLRFASPSHEPCFARSNDRIRDCVYHNERPGNPRTDELGRMLRRLPGGWGEGMAPPAFIYGPCRTTIIDEIAWPA